MRRVKSVDTKPEMIVRRLLFRLGYRYRLHDKRLPGCPDIVLKKHKCVVFVHGCFWHGHSCKRGDRLPASNADYWRRKIDANRHRDNIHMLQLSVVGWRVLTVWECQIRDIGLLENVLVEGIG